MDAGAARVAINDTAQRFADLIRSAPDPEASVVRSDWCVREVATHLVVNAEAFERYLTGDKTPVIDITDLATSNPAAIATVQERDVATLTDKLQTAVSRYLELTDGRSVDEPMWWHGVESTVGGVYGLFLGELLVHGDDVARTVRRPWPVDGGAATTVLEGMLQVAPLFLNEVRARQDATFEVRVRTGLSFVLRFSDGMLAAELGRARDADCRVRADPAALVFVLYGRRSQWGEIARGRLMSFGRRPWLAFGLTDRFGGF